MTISPWRIVAVLFVSSFAVAACPKGTEPYQGICAEMPSPESSTLAPAIGVISDEKPSKHPEPAYQRGEVHADIVPLPGVKRDPVEHDYQAEKAER